MTHGAWGFSRSDCMSSVWVGMNNCIFGMGFWGQTGSVSVLQDRG